MMNIEIKLGDITAANVDAIVNAANPAMLGGGGVDGAIHKVAGPQLLEACKKVKLINGIRCPFGEARITESGNLNCDYVIHTVGPIYRNESDPPGILTAAYSNSCKLAIENDCKSIAFPAISCGVYGYPHKEAAEIAIKTCSDKRYADLQVYFYLYDKSLYALFSNQLKALR